MHSARIAAVLALVGAVAACDDGVVGGGVLRDAQADATRGRDATTDATLPVSDAPPSRDVAPSADVPPAMDAPPPPADAPPAMDAPPLDAGRTCPAAGTPTDCSPGMGTGMSDQCHDGPSCYISLVQAAVRRTIAAHPTWFDSSDAGCPVITNVDGYMDSVVADLLAHGVCAIRDPNAPGEEVTVKHDNAFSENFDIVASTGCARYGALIYTGYCAPAWW